MTSTTLKDRLKRHDPTLTIPASVSLAEQPAGVRIVHVEPDSPAARAGLVVGDVLLAINRKPVRDTVDFFFHGAASRLALDLRSDEGVERRVTIRKTTPEQDLGIEVEQFVTQACGCNCVFCFVHQLPDNMRRTLYVKDEDYRLSFLQGSYVTGVTLKESDLERIARQRLTPLYISVHAIDEELRRWLLGIKKAYPILDLLKFFRKNRLTMHTQIVLTPGHNDGEKLRETLRTLLDFHPTVASVAIVPLGLTKWRAGLPDLTPVTPDYARRFLADARPMVDEAIARFGQPIVMLSDEWYLIASKRPPAYSRWPDVPQLENGVGMVYHFYKDAAAARRLVPKSLERPWKVAAITSTLSSPVLSRVIDIAQTCPQISVTPLPTLNSVFGDTIHVTGLLCGVDLRRAIDENPGYDQYLLPGNCLRKYDARFLDDVTLPQLREQTGRLITPVLGGAYDFIATILEQAAGQAYDAPKDHAFLAPHWSNS